MGVCAEAATSPSKSQAPPASKRDDLEVLDYFERPTDLLAWLDKTVAPNAGKKKENR